MQQIIDLLLLQNLWRAIGGLVAVVVFELAGFNLAVEDIDATAALIVAILSFAFGLNDVTNLIGNFFDWLRNIGGG
jgi:hypothetical protein